MRRLVDEPSLVGGDSLALRACVEAYLNFDVPQDVDPEPPDGALAPPLRVEDESQPERDKHAMNMTA